MSDESVVHDERRLNGSPPSFMLSAVRDLNPGSLVDLVKPILTVQDDAIIRAPARQSVLITFVF